MNIHPTILVAIATGFFGLAGTLVKYYFDNRKLKDQRQYEQKLREAEENRRLVAEKELRDSYVDLTTDFESFTAIYGSVKYMFKNTCADRFIIFIGRNGKSDFRIVTAVWEQHRDSGKAWISWGATKRFKRYKTDLFYKGMMKEIEERGMVSLVVKDMPECDLRGFYVAEEVVESQVFHLARIPIDPENDMLIYASIATHEEGGFDVEKNGFIKSQMSIIENAIITMKQEVE